MKREFTDAFTVRQKQNNIRQNSTYELKKSIAKGQYSFFDFTIMNLSLYQALRIRCSTVQVLVNEDMLPSFRQLSVLSLKARQTVLV